MRDRRKVQFCAFSISILALILACTALRSGWSSIYGPENQTRFDTGATISGKVHDANGPVAGAVVRIQTTTRSEKTDSEGRFTLSVIGMGEGPFDLTAWARGYYIAGPLQASDGQRDLEFLLTAHATEDNPNYEWTPALCSPGPSENTDCCSGCHSRVGSDLYPFLPVDEWVLDAHSQSAVNPRFLSIYTGGCVNSVRDIRISSTTHSTRSDQTSNLQSSESSRTNCRPGYRLDFPESVGNCATCHVPVAAVNAPHEVDPTKISGVAKEGVTCDFCHKIWDVQLNPSTGLPCEDKPGVLSYEFRRPVAGQQFFAGPFDDVAPGLDTFLALQQQGQYCAPCHHGSFGGTVIYNSFGEWLESPYSDPNSTYAKTCQDCHMPSGRTCLMTLPQKGGRFRDPATIASHLMTGGSDVKHLQSAASLNLVAFRENEQIAVEVRVRNCGAGHCLPTGSPFRHIVLVVIATDDRGNQLPLRMGPRLPHWTGDLSDLPGRVYAKVLEDVATRVSPTLAFWRRTRIAADTRISPLETDASRYGFDATGGGVVSVEARLIYRRAPHELAAIKGWDDPDIVMARLTAVVKEVSQRSRPEKNEFMSER